MVGPVRMSHFYDEIEDGPPFATGPRAAALPALPIVTPLGTSLWIIFHVTCIGSEEETEGMFYLVRHKLY